MKILKLLKDKRNLIHFKDFFKSTKNRKFESIDVVFTLDLEKDLENKFDIKQLSKILDMLKDYGAGTFFIESSLLKEYSFDLGKNEAASHGYGHLALGDDWWVNDSEKSKNRIKNIKKSNELIKSKFGKSPVSFRCPKFSKGKNINNILFELGYKYDSSSNPHNGENFPKKKNNILEIPVSRFYKPNFKFKKGIPFLDYNSLMFSRLKMQGADSFFETTKKIIGSWKGSEVPLINFMCHNWDFKTEEDFKLMKEYFDLLKKEYKSNFITLKEYGDKFNNDKS
ncbi:polysaccharide deacetylase family protein [archaeon]|jgi:hypothetical protein|nr:polysaccharide deacetylase family protein [archaeon]